MKKPHLFPSKSYLLSPIYYFFSSASFLCAVALVFLISTIIVSPRFASAAAPTNGLVGYWNFDEGSGTVATDSSGQGNNGTLVNSPTWTTGKLGQAISFNGTSSYVSITNSISVPSAFSLSWWMKTTTNTGKVISWGFTRFAAFGFASNKLNFTVDGDSTGSALSTTNINDGNWHHIVFVDNSNNQILYVDGVQESTATETLDTAAADIILGGYYPNSPQYNGLLDDVRLYSRALSPQEVLDIYNDTGAPPAGGPTTYTITSSAGTGGSISPSGITTVNSGSSQTYTITPNSGYSIASVLIDGASVGSVSSYTFSNITTNRTISATFTPNPPAGGQDTTPPSTPTNLTATAVSSSQINLSWTASTDPSVAGQATSGVSGYKIYRNGTQIGTSATNSYSDSSLSPNTTYSYTISAYDAAGNNSSQSSSVSATTQSGTVASGNIYIAQTATGSGNGTSCANAYAYTFFNSFANWGSGTGKIGPGVTVHLCGTITNSLTFRGSGTATNLIKLVWEPGAKLSQPYCATACVNSAGYDYLVLDGGTNGIIENTANGSLLTYQKWSTAIDANGCDGCEIKNIHIQNLYIHAYADEAIDNTAARGIEVSGNNWLIHGNVLHDVMWAIMNEYASGNSGGRIYNNEIYNVDHAFAVLGSGAITVGPFYIYNNYVHDYAIWDTPSGHWHHDGIHAFGTGSAGACPLVTELWIYNNLFTGDTGDSMTGHTFLEGGGCDGVHTPWTTSGGHAIIFNNVLIGTPGRLVYGLFQTGHADGNLVYNNTVIGNNPTIGSALIVNNAPNFTFKNNFISGNATLIGTGGTTTLKSAGSLDNNVYANCAGSNCFSGFGLFTSNFASWKTASGGDVSSISTLATNGGVNTSGVPQSGSLIIGAGANLFSLGIIALNSDKAGVARPLTAPWDIGAYQYTGSVPTSSTKFTPGQRIQTTSSLNVRATASATGTLLGTQPSGALGTIVSGGTYADGYFWWNVNYDNAPDGYSVENYLTKYTAPIPGDLNSDGLVNSIDLSLLVSKWNQSYPAYDLNSDGIINSLDFAIMSSNWSV